MFQNACEFVAGDVVVVRVGKRCVLIWWDGVIVEELFVETCELVYRYVDGDGVFLLEHTPELFGFILEYIRELEL
jgi:hypothetical protein